MRYFVGIDLGSTTTKAVILDDHAAILGRGITNSRSNYKVACDVALAEALINARFELLAEQLDRAGLDDRRKQRQLDELGRLFKQQQYLGQLHAFGDIARGLLDEARAGGVRKALEFILDAMEGEAVGLFAPGATRKSDFFRDLAASRYLALADDVSQQRDVPFDRLVGLFDKAILEVENLPSAAASFEAHARAALAAMQSRDETLAAAVERAATVEMEEAASVGTGYGRATLPFPKDRIRSEILCHGLGAHQMFPATRTVLDIGGQDTKAIQVDEQGIVTSFQMNDRCAAGCGRYLGYIADEMNLGVHELGPLACASKRTVRINSTCTVFAGAELRERLSLGEKREDILAGLHRAIILRAMSLVARSGGITNQFTFTGGVAKNEAAVAALSRLVQENYGDVEINISPDSIYTGALGAALFAGRSVLRPDATLEERPA